MATVSTRYLGIDTKNNYYYLNTLAPGDTFKSLAKACKLEKGEYVFCENFNNHGDVVIHLVDNNYEELTATVKVGSSLLFLVTLDMATSIWIEGCRGVDRYSSVSVHIVEDLSKTESIDGFAFMKRNRVITPKNTLNVVKVRSKSSNSASSGIVIPYVDIDSSNDDFVLFKTNYVWPDALDEDSYPYVEEGENILLDNVLETILCTPYLCKESIMHDYLRMPELEELAMGRVGSKQGAFELYNDNGFITLKMQK